MKQPMQALVLIIGFAFPLSNVIARAAEVDLSDPAQAMETWIRLKGDLSGHTTYEWMTGVVYGVPDGAKAQALFMVESVTVRETRPNAEGIYQDRNFSCRLYKDAETGAFITSWDNPFTGKRVDFNVKCNPGIPVSMPTAGLKIPLDIPYDSSAINAPMIIQRIDAGDHVILRHDNRAVFTTSAGEVRPELSVDTFKLKEEDLNNTDVSALFPAYGWTSNTNWMSIFEMQDVPGHMIWDLHGYKFTRAEDLPAAFQAALEELEPGILSKSIVWSD